MSSLKQCNSKKTEVISCNEGSAGLRSILVLEEDELYPPGPLLLHGHTNFPRKVYSAHTEEASSVAHAYPFSSSLMAVRSVNIRCSWEMKFRTVTQWKKQYRQQKRCNGRKEKGGERTQPTPSLALYSYHWADISNDFAVITPVSEGTPVNVMPRAHVPPD